jgi:DNA-binding FrmR family transcriptional regulator
MEEFTMQNITIREEKLKSNIITRLNKIEGQIRGVKGMIEKDVYCNDILIQISAAQAALDSVSKLVLENHIRGCLVSKIQSGENEIVDELIVTIGKML